MIQSHTVDQHCQGSRAGTVAGLAQSPLTRLRSVPIPKPIEELAQTPVSSDLPRAIARTAVRVRVPFFTLPTSRMSGDGFFVLQQWEGKVSDVSGEDVTAVVRDWTNPTMPDEEVTVSIDEFSPDDQSLLAPGTVVAALNWRDAGKIGYALGPDVTMLCLSADARQFGFAHPLGDYAGRDVLVLEVDPAAPASAWFERTEALAPASVRLDGRVLRTVTVLRGIGLRVER